MIPLLLIGAAALSAFGGSPPATISDAVVPIRSVNPTDDDFSDLEPLIDLIGEARIVQLAEATHGEGTSVLAHTRLARFLHERMGFDIIVFESPFFEMRDVNEALRRGDPLPEALWDGLYDVWSRTEEIQHLFRLIQRSHSGARPLIVAGADSQLLDERSPERICRAIEQFLANDPHSLTVADAQQFRELVERLRVDHHGGISAETFATGIELLERIHYLLATPSERLRATTSAIERGWWVRVVATVRHGWEDAYLSALAPAFDGSNLSEIASHPMFHAASNRRDRAMAENIAWLAEVAWPGRKLIVWGATSHLQEAGAGVVPGNDEYEAVRVYTTGEHLTGPFGREVFTIITTAFEGEYASPSTKTREGDFRWSRWSEQPAAENSTEAALRAMGLDYLIVDAGALDEALTLPRGIVYDDAAPAPLRKYCDAVLFINRMMPPTPLPANP